jgi:hypothetical protein
MPGELRKENEFLMANMRKRGANPGAAMAARRAGFACRLSFDLFAYPSDFIRRRTPDPPVDWSLGRLWLSS